MEKGKIYDEMCNIFSFDKTNKKLLYVSDRSLLSIYKDLLFRFCFLEEKGPVKFETLDDLWLLKEYKSPSQIKLILDIIESMILVINNRKHDLFASSINSVKTLLNVMDYETLEIFRYLQSIYSSYGGSPSNIIFPLIYTIAFNKPLIKKNLKSDCIEIASIPLEKMNVNDYIDYETINKEFLKYFNGLLNVNENDKKDCYKYLCDFTKNYSNNKKLEINESFQYFSGLKDIINESEKNFIVNKSIKNEDDEDKENKNSISDTSDKTDNNNSPEKIGINDEVKNEGKLNETNHEEKIKENMKEKLNEKKIKEENKKEGINNQDLKIEKKEDEVQSQLKEINKGIQTEQSAEDKSKDANINDIQKESHSDFNLMIKVLRLNKLCSRIQYILNSLNINKESIEKYYTLQLSNIDNKLLLNKLSSTIMLLQNANIINIKRKLVECLLFEIYEKYKSSINFEGKYSPSKYNIDELLKIIDNIKENSKEPEKTQIDLDYNNLIAIKNTSVQQTDSNINIDAKSNKNYFKLKMVTEFLRFCKKNLHPFVHAEGSNLDYYLLTNNLFESNLKRANLLFSLDDMIETKRLDEKSIKDKLDELGLNEEWQIYKKSKKIDIREALRILLNPKAFYINDKKYSNDLKEIKFKLQQDLSKFNDYYNVFIQNSSKGFAIDIITEPENLDEEKDLIDLLAKYEENLLSIFKNQIERKKAKEIINSITQTVKEEVFKAERYIDNIDNSAIDYKQTEKTLMSKIKRIYLCVKFLDNQGKAFTNYQLQIYNEYESSANQILKKSETLKDILQSKTFIEQENLLDKWFKTKPSFEKAFLNETNMRNNFIDLISYVDMNISYTFDEKFSLWMIQNKYSHYLRK